jgi:hypothetical protein
MIQKRTSMRIWVTLWVALCALPIGGYAQTEKPPDWTGYYMLARGRDAAGLNIISPDLDKTVIEHLQPWAKAKMEATNGIADDTGAVCSAAGILRVPGTPYSGNFSLLNTPGKVVMAYALITTSRVRRIYLNQQHPRNPRPTWNGHSIGRWEGDTLMVDTIGFNDKSWLSPTMTPHTEETHLIERMRQIQRNSNTYIEIVGTVEDRHALTSAYTYSRYYKKQSREMPESSCADDIAMWKEWRNLELNLEYERARQVK